MQRYRNLFNHMKALRVSFVLKALPRRSFCHIGITTWEDRTMSIMSRTRIQSCKWGHYTKRQKSYATDFPTL
jgi:hypothetical protein